MPPTVDISTLAESAIIRQKDLKMLPVALLSEVLGLHGINLLPNIQNKHVRTDYLRKQGIMRPYNMGDVVHSDIGKTQEMTLQVETAYASVKDNIQNYQEITVGPDVLLGKNKSKKHPWQRVMLDTIVKTFGEDLIDCLFQGERVNDGSTPLEAFDGYDAKITAFITALIIATNKGNLYNTGEIAAPTAENDYAAYTTLMGFWRAANPFLRNKKSNLMVPFAIGDMYDDAYFNKYRQKPNQDIYGRSILDGSGGKCTIVRSNTMGTGQRIILTAPGNLEFGLDSQGDDKFIQVRNPYEDPNLIQFWIQGKYGTRINSVHQKLFQINEGTPVGQQLSGDYS